VARTLLFPEPVSQNIRFIDRINGVPAACWHCITSSRRLAICASSATTATSSTTPCAKDTLIFGGISLGPTCFAWANSRWYGQGRLFPPSGHHQPGGFWATLLHRAIRGHPNPAAAAWLQHRFGDALGFQDIAGNVVWNFDEFNPVGLGVGGTPWAVNFGDQKRAFAFSNGLFDAGECNGSRTPGVCNPNHVNFGLYRERVPDWRFGNDGVGMKWDFSASASGDPLRADRLVGIGQTPVFRRDSASGAGRSDSSRAISSGSNFAASGVNCSKLATISSGFPGFYGPGGGGTAIIATNARSIHLAKGVNPHTFLNDCTFGAGTEIRYQQRQYAGTVRGLFSSPFTGVIVRVESSWTHNALLNDTDSLDWTTNNDILQYVVGIDRPHFIRFLNPDDSFFTSFQVFETYYPGAHSSNGGKDGLVTWRERLCFHRRSPRRTTIVTRSSRSSSRRSAPRHRLDGRGNTEWLITDHWSAAIGFDAFLGKSHQHNIGSNAAFQAGHTAPQDAAYSETIFGPSHMQAGGAQRNKDDEFWTRIRYRF